LSHSSLLLKRKRCPLSDFQFSILPCPQMPSANSQLQTNASHQVFFSKFVTTANKLYPANNLPLSKQEFKIPPLTRVLLPVIFTHTTSQQKFLIPKSREVCYSLLLTFYLLTRSLIPILISHWYTCTMCLCPSVCLSYVEAIRG
jgi:hypothetical protein